MGGGIIAIRRQLKSHAWIIDANWCGVYDHYTECYQTKRILTSDMASNNQMLLCGADQE